MQALKNIGKQIQETVQWAHRQPPPINVDDVQVREDIKNDPVLFEQTVDEMERQVAEKYPNNTPSRPLIAAVRNPCAMLVNAAD
jgi:hypothetical protein